MNDIIIDKMSVIKKKYLINAPVEKVWESLVNPKIIDKWGAGPAEMSDEIGFNFKLWGGDVFGKNKEVVKNKKLVQDWYGGNWEKPSKVIFTLTKKNKETLLELIQTNVPDKEFEDINHGWDLYYLRPIKEYLEK